MMTIKYIIEMKHSCPLSTKSTYYYKGQDKKGVTCFTPNKRVAKRYVYKDEAIRDMNILAAVHNYKTDTFEVIDINCRV